MKKIILILSGIFIYNFLFAQNPFNKKGAWEVNFGLNYHCPTINKYQGGFGGHIGLFRTIKLNKINDKNSFNVLIGLSYNLTRIKCDEFNEHLILYESYNYPCLDIKFSSMINLKEKYGIYNAVGFRINTFEIFDYVEYYLTYSLGFLFYFKKINIMPCVDFEIIDLKKNNYKHSCPLLMGVVQYKKEYFNHINFGISIFFNKPFKNKENEEK